jgi:fluoroacetyl-CoA thioesterase
MKSSLVPGLTVTRQITVDEKRTIGFMGEEGRVYATPEMVRDIEQTCRDFLLQHADAGEDSVGMRVELDHLAPTPLGFSVAIEATVVEIQGRVVTFEVNARDDFDQIGRGRHMRFVADTAKSKARIAAKRAKATGPQSG